jgi:hypothetical protein
MRFIPETSRPDTVDILLGVQRVKVKSERAQLSGKAFYMLFITSTGRILIGRHSYYIARALFLFYIMQC